MSPIVLIATVPNLLRGPVGRPELSGPVHIEDVEGVRLHYTTEGVDAVEMAYLDEIRRGLTEGLAVFEAEGWPAPLPDDGTGGSTAIDVYVVDLDANGYANPLRTGDGDASCFIRIDPGLPDLGGTVASVARHELHHCIQFRFRTDLPPWLYESGATYEQYSHAGNDPLLELAVGVLWSSRLARPEQRLGDDRDVYATFLWSKFWAEHTAYDPSRLVDLWEALRGTDTWPVAMERAAQEAFDSDLGDVFLQYAVHNRFACGQDDGLHYLDDPLPCVVEAARVPSQPFTSPITVRHDERRFTAAYFDVSPAEEDGPFGIRCEGSEGVRAALVTVDGSGRQIDVAIEDPRTDTLWITRRAGEQARLVVAGTDALLDATCTEVLPAMPAAGCSTQGTRSVGLMGAGLLLLRRRRRMFLENGS